MPSEATTYFNPSTFQFSTVPPSDYVLCRQPGFPPRYLARTRDGYRIVTFLWGVWFAIGQSELYKALELSDGGFSIPTYWLPPIIERALYLSGAKRMRRIYHYGSTYATYGDVPSDVAHEVARVLDLPRAKVHK
jgi:hypothetical protein